MQQFSVFWILMTFSHFSLHSCYFWILCELLSTYFFLLGKYKGIPSIKWVWVYEVKRKNKWVRLPKKKKHQRKREQELKEETKSVELTPAEAAVTVLASCQGTGGRSKQTKRATLLHPPLPVLAPACILFHLLDTKDSRWDTTFAGKVA